MILLRNPKPFEAFEDPSGPKPPLFKTSCMVPRCVLRVGWCLMGPTAFSEVFKPRCFSPVKDNRHLRMGQQLPAGFTVSSFLDKLQILEQKLAERNNGNVVSAVDMAVYMLRTFFHDDYEWDGLAIKSVGNTDVGRSVLHHVMDAVTANLGRPIIKPDELLDDQLHRDDDLCFLMFSLAHNVNKTLVRHDRFDTYSVKEDDELLKLPREEGVLSVTGRKDGSVVAMGKTLLGIAASHPDLQVKTIKDVLKAVSSEGEKDGVSDGNLNPIYAATIGSLLAGTALMVPKSQLRNTMGMKGKWLEDGCFLEYKLDGETNTSCTLAQITGAIDACNKQSAQVHSLHLVVLVLGKVMSSLLVTVSLSLAPETQPTAANKSFFLCPTPVHTCPKLSLAAMGLVMGK
ncbi:hypothetical protein HPB50_019960 [Hyalomma asiaticum]|uniref:Uncharacterized protein n=1 Tax=Hyalomma asiaticum TaxID=266040 RepID=A0ACB7SYA0_HYAAI|nr:hypothetical protein HPB50_019960 [Hyalomma asiaticum]